MNIHIIIYIISAVIFLVLFIILIRFLTDKKRLLAAEIKGRYNATALLTPTEAAFFPVIDEIAADYGLYGHYAGRGAAEHLLRLLAHLHDI